MAKQKITLEQVRSAAPVSDPDRFRDDEPAERGGEPAAPEAPPSDAPRRKRGQGRGSTPLGVSLYKDEIEALDGMVEELRRSGFAPATRSLVMREAFQRLKEEASDLRGGDLINFFISREAKRRSA